jgi:hypothetical protein
MFDSIPGNPSVRLALFTALTLLETSSALAGLGAPSGVSSTGVLPQGVWNTRLGTVVGSFDEKYDDRGDLVPAGNDINKVVKWKDAIMVQKTDADKATLQSLMTGRGYSLEDSPGQTSGQINVGVSAFAPVLGRGITDDWTMAVVVPVVRFDISAAKGFLGNQQGQNIINDITASSASQGIKNALMFNSAVDEMTNYYGYKPIKSKQETSIGDVQLVSKHRLINQGNQTLSVQGQLGLPTGKKSDIDDLLDTATSSGTPAIGATVAYDRKYLVGGLGFGSYMGITYLVPDSIEMRIPKDGDLLAKDKETVSRKLGSRMGFGIGPSYDLSSTGILGLSANAGYHFQYQERATYTGSKYEGYRYERLESEKEPESYMHSASIGIGYSTVPLFRSGSFALPLDVGFSYGKILSAKNSNRADRLVAELSLFF